MVLPIFPKNEQKIAIMSIFNREDAQDSDFLGELKRPLIAGQFGALASSSKMKCQFLWPSPCERQYRYIQKFYH